MLSNSAAASQWFVSHAPDALVLSRRPRDAAVREGVANQHPFPRQASHVVVHRRGSVVLINCDVAGAQGVLSLLMDTSTGVAAPPTPVPPAGDIVAALQATPPRSLAQRLYRWITAVRGSMAQRPSVGPTSPPPPRPPAAFASAYLARHWFGTGDAPPPPDAPDAPARRSALLGKPVDFMTIGTDGAIPVGTWAVLQDSPRPRLAIRRLDLSSVWLVSAALAHSVQLQQVERAVEGLHGALVELSSQVARGQATAVPRAALHSLRSRVTQLRDSVYLFNLWGRARTALARNSPSSATSLDSHAGHERLAELLKEELELVSRLADVEGALEHVDSTVKYVVAEQEEGSIHRLEVLIVIILSLELAFSLWELWGGGHEVHASAAAQAV